MTSISATKAREHIYKLIQEVNQNSTPVTITNNKGKNAVLISEDDWNAISETLYLNSVPGLAKSILDSAKEPIDLKNAYDENEAW